VSQGLIRSRGAAVSPAAILFEVCFPLFNFLSIPGLSTALYDSIPRRPARPRPIKPRFVFSLLFLYSSINFLTLYHFRPLSILSIIFFFPSFNFPSLNLLNPTF
jgi:hypothetical protein